MGLQKKSRVEDQSAPPTPVRRVGQGRVKAASSHWVPQNSQGQRAKVGGSWIPRVEKPKVTAAGGGAGQRSRDSPSLPSSARRPGGPAGHRALPNPAAPRPQRTADMPPARGTTASPAPAGSCSPKAYGGREGTTRLESADRTTIPRGQRGAGGGGHAPVAPSDWLFAVVAGRDRAVAWATLRESKPSLGEPGTWVLLLLLFKE